jgi:hypothetical protein
MTPDTRFVPKVHPAGRPAEAEDPLEMHAVALAGDPKLMLECLVREYAWLGWGPEEVLLLFEDPFYPALAELRRLYGDAGLRERVAESAAQAGGFQLRVTVCEAPAPEEPDEPEPELLELGMPGGWRNPGPAGGNDHA